MPLERLLAAAFGFVTIAAIVYTVVAIVCVARFGRESRRRNPISPRRLACSFHSTVPSLALRITCARSPSRTIPNFKSFSASRAPTIPRSQSHDASQRRFPIGISISTSVRSAVRVSKIANVLSMMRLVRHKTLILADSDTRVTPSYIGSVTAPLRDPNVGVVTCPLHGVPRATFSSKPARCS